MGSERSVRSVFCVHNLDKCVYDLLAHMKIDEVPENNLMDISLHTKKIEHLRKIL